MKETVEKPTFCPRLKIQDQGSNDTELSAGERGEGPKNTELMILETLYM